LAEVHPGALATGPYRKEEHKCFHLKPHVSVYISTIIRIANILPLKMQTALNINTTASH
jgi:hypothetical protein